MTPSRHLARHPVVPRVLAPAEVEAGIARVAPWIARVLESPVSSLEVLQATEKSQVYAFAARGVALVAKIHTDPAAWHREKLGLMLFRGGPVPQLVAVAEEVGLLVMTRLAGRAFEVGRDPLPAVVSALALLHRVGRSNLALVAASGRRPEDPPASDDSAYAKRMRALMADCKPLWGPGHVPVAIADLKPEHVIVALARCGFVDLETVSVGCSELYDLLSLVDFCSDPATFWRQWRGGLAERYLAHAGLGPSATPALLTRAMEQYEAAMVGASAASAGGA